MVGGKDVGPIAVPTLWGGGTLKVRHELPMVLVPFHSWSALTMERYSYWRRYYGTTGLLPNLRGGPTRRGLTVSIGALVERLLLRVARPVCRLRRLEVA